jgi:hypothetical protein
MSGEGNSKRLPQQKTAYLKHSGNWEAASYQAARAGANQPLIHWFRVQLRHETIHSM